MNTILKAQPPSSHYRSWQVLALSWRGVAIFFSLATATCLFGAKPEFSDITHLFTPVANRAPVAASPALVVQTNPPSPVAASTPVVVWTNAGLPAASNAGAVTPAHPVSPVATTSTNAASAAALNNMEALDDQYHLAVGDRLSFRIVEDEEEPKALFVTDSGDLEMPYIGRFPAAGKTCKQLARELRSEYEKEYYIHASIIVAVDLMVKSRGKVYLIGPVRMPGPQEIPSDEVLTLSKAILRAGGFNDFADKRNVKVTRRGSVSSKEDQTFVVNVADVLEKGKSESDLPLQPGDFIYVPERLIRF